MMLFNCPKCGGALINTGFDTAGQHWRCASCGLTETGVIYTFSYGTTSPDAENAKLRAENELLKRTIVRMQEEHDHPQTYATSHYTYQSQPKQEATPC